MFTKIGQTQEESVRVWFEGCEMTVGKGLSVAAALLGEGITHFRNTPVTAAERGPFCMMGVCFDCLLVIDGQANLQACMVEVSEGMCIERQCGAADPELDPALAATANRGETTP
ncbi:MAG: (2Fe-2S)-binding protein [Gammaproteobacteria bacterium]|nr:(2Fe-2S)-binding protein [Gammaproteobacteria bacterium]